MSKVTSLFTPQSSPLALIWDFDNKLRSADLGNNSSVDVNFQYDALGRRVARTGTGGSVVYVQHDQQTIADYPVGGVASTPTYRYVYASYIDEPVVRKAAGTSGTIHYYHRNQQYSITAMTTSTGAVAERYAYTAYGQPTILNASGSVLTSSAVGNRYTYTGREWDETLGLHHFRARWMSPLAGRFLGRDPITLLVNRLAISTIARTMSNSYQYVSARTLVFVDPSGLIQDEADESPYTGPIQDLIDEIINTPLDDLTGPGGLPMKPDDIIGIGGDALDAIIGIIISAGTSGSPCNRLFHGLYRDSVCGAATCNPNECPKPAPVTQGSAGPFNDCLDEATKEIPKLRPLLEDKIRGLIDDAIVRCREAATNGPCCKNGKPIPPKPCPWGRGPFPTRCSKIRDACINPKPIPGPMPKVRKFPMALR
jgi:RHS repeat-associated protein